MFSVTKKLILASLTVALCLTASQVLAGADSVVVKRAGWTAISIPIILDKEEETTSRVLKMVASLNRENEKRALKDQPLEKCDSNPILGKILTGFHQHIRQAFKEDIDGLNTRQFVLRSGDSGLTWSEPIWLDSPGDFYERGHGGRPIRLANGAILWATYYQGRG